MIEKCRLFSLLALLGGIFGGLLYFFYARALSNPKPQPCVTVWIHGTQPTFRSLPSFLKTKVQTLSKKHFYPPYGLASVQALPPTNRHCSIAHELAQADPIHYPAQHFYTFGWSGRLGFEIRYEAAQYLYDELVALVEEYTKEYGAAPHLRIITHSHGGNVALNLARVHQERGVLLPIDELILLACPVQHATAAYAQDPLFKRVYHFYSRKDIIQVGDPQRLYAACASSVCFFSQRSFCPHPRITQMQVMMNRRSMFHIEFLLHRFVQALPGLIAYAREHDNPATTTIINIACTPDGPMFSSAVKKEKKVCI